MEQRKERRFHPYEDSNQPSIFERKQNDDNNKKKVNRITKKTDDSERSLPASVAELQRMIETTRNKGKKQK